jgi:hypothetical protein
MCGSDRFVWFVQVCMVRTGLCGSYRFVWFVQVCVVRTGLCGSYRFVWFGQVCVVRTGLCGSDRFVWFVQLRGFCEENMYTEICNSWWLHFGVGNLIYTPHEIGVNKNDK